MNCRHCHRPVTNRFLDLTTSPPSNAYLAADQLNAPEKYYPLRVLVCEDCFLVQTEDFADRTAFFSEDYAYFSSFSTSWLKHSAAYVTAMIDRFDLGPSSLVVEVAANDGYLLQYVQEAGVGALGIEPTGSTAAAARAKGIEIVEEFFGEVLGARLAVNGRAADLTAANNVLAHVPDINDFVTGFARLLKPAGVATFEFPHLLNMIEQLQFDTVYHEHFSYLSLYAVERIFRANGLSVFDVEEVSTHGGSLRVFAQRSDTGTRPVTSRVSELLEREQDKGVARLSLYEGFQAAAERIRDDLLGFLTDAKREGRHVAAYGAAAKGNTLLNFAGVKRDQIAFVADLNPAKQGRFMPGSRLPITDADAILTAKPDYVLILPWNIKDEVMAQLAFIRDWGGRFVVAIPSLTIL